jgi:oligopeptide/dipeptide ABC transporter ATP-binding protein
MRQRVMIAMALCCEASLLIADEPTTALDVTTQANILSLIHELQRDLNMSVMFITHDLGVVAEIADSVVVMYLGEVVESGSVTQIFKNPLHPYTKALMHSIPQISFDDHSGFHRSAEWCRIPSAALWAVPSATAATRCAAAGATRKGRRFRRLSPGTEYAAIRGGWINE